MKSNDFDMEKYEIKFLGIDEFRAQVLLRDKNNCVICKDSKDIFVHYIIDQRLFSDDGYQINNGASLCSTCHLKAEMTIISVEEIRNACGIQNKDKVIPEHLCNDQIYDKWANPILPNGRRMMGELFDEPSVQKILNEGNVLGLFSRYVKYPRTWHLRFSEGATKDDRILLNHDIFNNKQVVVSLKLDGENTTMINDHIHARSLSDKNHWSKSWIKSFHGGIAHDIPENMRLVVENVYAKHSIYYKDLESYCYGISVWDKLTCLDWDSSVEWFHLFGIPPVTVLYRGVWKEEIIKCIKLDYNLNEGYVVRLSDSFHYRNFSKSVAKFVRKNHVRENNEHWFHNKSGEINKLKD